MIQWHCQSQGSAICVLGCLLMSLRLILMVESDADLQGRRQSQGNHKDRKMLSKINYKNKFVITGKTILNQGRTALKSIRKATAAWRNSSFFLWSVIMNKASKDHRVTGTVQERRKRDERSVTINILPAACLQISGMFKGEKKRCQRDSYDNLNTTVGCNSKI